MGIFGYDENYHGEIKEQKKDELTASPVERVVLFRARRKERR